MLSKLRLFREIISTIVLLGSVSTAIYKFIPIWNGNMSTQAILPPATVWGILGVGLIFYTFRSYTLNEPSQDTTSTQDEPSTRQYSFVFKVFVTVFLVIWIILTPVLIWQSYSRYQELQGKFIVSVANFHGRDPKKYQVTLEVIEKVRDALSEFDDSKVQPLGKTITEEQGQKYARKLGRNHIADLVIWGRYTATETSVKSTIHIENLMKQKYVPLPQSGKYTTPIIPVEGIENFKFQLKRANEISTLALFVSGMARYGLDDFKGAIKRFSKTLIQKSWPSYFLSRTFPFIYRGNSFLFTKKFKDAIHDYNEVLNINPNLYSSYNNRGIAYQETGKYERAIEDFNRAIDLDPDNAEFYNNRGNTYSKMGQYEKALKDYEKAMDLDVDKAEFYNNRGGDLL